MVDRIKDMRSGIKERIKKMGKNGKWEKIKKKIGML
jgi:aspartate/tyrosine/aromatic aminotransferase